MIIIFSLATKAPSKEITDVFDKVCYRFLQDVCSYSELSAMEQRFNIAEMLADKRIYTEIMDKTGASSAIISRVSRVLSADGSVLRELLEADKNTH